MDVLLLSLVAYLLDDASIRDVHASSAKLRASYRQCSSRAQVAVVDVATRYNAKDPSDYSKLTIPELTGILLASGESTKGAKPDL